MTKKSYCLPRLPLGDTDLDALLGAFIYFCCIVFRLFIVVFRLACSTYVESTVGVLVCMQHTQLYKT